ncbi:MAG: hypothetical protein JNJ61_01265 [Anaerolineae bacterium]|nr:hypothetical protein [Anaerolineae bacterium]
MHLRRRDQPAAVPGLGAIELHDRTGDQRHGRAGDALTMALSGTHTFVGFGFGAIQSNLFLYEAFQSGNFGRLVVAEVVPEVVAAIRQDGGMFRVNIAHPDGVQQASVGPVQIENPGQPDDRARLITALADAHEISTAVPSVSFYASPDEGSLHHILAEGLRQKARAGGPRAVIYAAENHNHAAEILEARVFEAIPAAEHATVREHVRFLNTVIGKMGGVVTSPEEMQEAGLVPVTSGGSRAFLVEAFNRILISRIDFGNGVPFARGISVFEEKADLLPFEEAKLYGHNAAHALAAYLGWTRGLKTIAELPQQPGLMAFLRAAFIEESGGALIRKYDGLDALFTPAGYTAYVDDLLARMTNPYLRDTVERVGRDPQRKLGWDDRLIGTMRLALRQGIRPVRFALGAAAALELLRASQPGEPDVLLDSLWRDSAPDATEREAVLALIHAATDRLRAWRAAGFEPMLERVVGAG